MYQASQSKPPVPINQVVKHSRSMPVLVMFKSRKSAIPAYYDFEKGVWIGLNGLGRLKNVEVWTM